MVYILIGAHDPTDNYWWYRSAVVWTAATPLHTTFDAAAAKTVPTTIITKPPGRLMLQVWFKAKVTLPPFGKNLLRSSSVGDFILRWIYSAGLGLDVCQARGLHISYARFCGS